VHNSPKGAPEEQGMGAKTKKDLEKEIADLQARIRKLAPSQPPETLDADAGDQLEKDKSVSGRLRESEKRYHELFSKMLDGFAVHEIICDEDGKPCDYRFLEVNPAFEHLTGLRAADLIGRTVLEVLPKTEPHWINTYGRVALTGEPVHFEDYAQELDRYYEVTAYSPVKGRFAVVFADVTERKHAELDRVKLEQQLQESQKLESLGLLAGGIAHDFNNLLTSIVGNTDLALDELGPSSPLRESLEGIERAAGCAADLCKQLLAYSGKGRFEVQRLDLGAVIEEMTHILDVSIPKKVSIKYSLAPRLPAVAADPSQIRQVVMNFITNAAEAIGDKRGTISITTGDMLCDADYLAATLPGETLEEGRYAYIEVSDTGVGMDPATIARIFDPFFTTKFTGRGLGMAAVLGIVRGHRGAISIHSEPGRGATFRALLPAVSETAAPIARNAGDGDGWKGTGVVLLVDDEETVRSVGRRMIQKLGFDVVTANDGLEAAAVFKARAEEIVCVVLDLTMPNMDGAEAYRELQRMRADVPVVLSSGYNEQDAIHRFSGEGLAGFVQKPYTLSVLARKMREVLGVDA